MIYSDYVVLVQDHLTVDADRRGLEKFQNRMIRNSVIDLQRYIRAYRTGHTTTYDVIALTVIEQGMFGNLPANAIPEAFYIQDTATGTDGLPHPNCKRNRLDFWPWINRKHMLCTKSENRLYAYSIDPYGKTFVIHPAVNSDTQLLLVWEGLKMDFADGDTVPWPDTAAEASAAYVKWRILLEIDKNPVLAREQFAIFTSKRLSLFRDEQEKQDAEKPDAEYAYSGGGWGGGSEFGGNGFITGNTPILNGIQSYAILFNPPFGSKPSFFSASVEMPNANGEVAAISFDGSTLTKNGVTVWLSGLPGPASVGGFINWAAQL